MDDHGRSVTVVGLWLTTSEFQQEIFLHYTQDKGGFIRSKSNVLFLAAECGASMDKSVPQLTTTNQKVPARLGLLGGSTLTCSRNMNCFSFLSCLLSAMVPWRWNVSSRNRQACPSTKLQMSQTIQWDDINMLNQMCQIRKCIKKIYSIGQMRHDVGKCVVRGVCVCGGRGGGERYSDSFKHLFV